MTTWPPWPLAAAPSRVHQLGKLNLLALLARYTELIMREYGDGLLASTCASWSREQLIDHIITTERRQRAYERSRCRRATGSSTEFVPADTVAITSGRL